MSSSELPEYAARNRELWTKANAEHTGDDRAAGVGGGGDHVGVFGESPRPS